MQKNNPEALPPPGYVVLLLEHGSPGSSLPTAIQPRSRYFACITLISATLPGAWQSVHVSGTASELERGV